MATTTPPERTAAGRWVRQAGHVFFVRPRLVWLLLVLIAAACLAIWRLHTELAARTTGFALGLSGVFLVAKGLREKAEMFRLPSLTERWKVWFIDVAALFRIVRRRDAIAILAGTGGISMTGFALTAFATTDGMTTDERLAKIDAEIAALRTEVANRDAASNKRIADLSTRIDDEGTERAKADQALHQRLTEIHVGGWDLEVVGLILVFVAGILTTFPDCAAAAFLGHWCHAQTP